MNLNVRIVHNEIFSQEIFHRWTINDVELRVPLQSVNQVFHSILELVPVGFVLLNFSLGSTEIFVELFEVIMIIDFVKFFLISDFLQISKDLFAKLGCFAGQLLLHLEEVPVLSDTVQ